MAERTRRVLLVEDVQVEALLLRKTLQNEAGTEFEVLRAELLRDAVSSLHNQPVDVVLLDLSLPDSSGLETFRTVRRIAPQVPIVVLTGVADEEIALQAVREGAQDYLVKGQVGGAQVVRALRYAMERQRALDGYTGAKRGELIAFIGAKGGVGTTTAVLNVAAALATGTHTALAAELRPSFGTFGLYIGDAPPVGLGSLLPLPAVEIEASRVDSQLYRLPSGLSLLLAPQKREEFGGLDADKSGAIVEGLTSLADYVILDLPAYPTPDARAALCRCDSIVIVTEREPVSTSAARMLMDLLHSWGVGGLVEGCVVVNRVANPAPIDLREITAATGCELLATIPPATEACSAAQREGRSVVNFLPTTPVAESFRELARRVARLKSALPGP